MRLPKLEGKTGSTELNRQFLGYRHVDAPDEGAFYEISNGKLTGLPSGLTAINAIVTRGI